MYKFFVEDNQINNDKIVINNEDYNHLVNVLRMKIGDVILITNKNSKETYKCEIDEIKINEVKCNILNKENKKVELEVKIDLYQGLPKADKMEYIIQKSVELGVNKIVPVNMKYCIAKIKDEEKKNIRWNKISEVAAKQCKRNIIPKIDKSINMDTLYNEIKKYDLVIVAYENEENITLKTALRESAKIKNIAVVVGPEGGFSLDEVDKLRENGAKIVSLGNRILRTETAPITILSMLVYEYEL